MMDMRESTTYQAILREGRIAGGQRILTRLGSMKFGKADGAILIAIEAIRDFDRLGSHVSNEFSTRTCATGATSFGHCDR